MAREGDATNCESPPALKLPRTNYRVGETDRSKWQ